MIRNLVVVSDIHAGCRLGLCPPGGVELDDGGTYLPSSFQHKLWSYWRTFWDEWVPRVTHHEPFAIVHNGDAIDGVHHGSVSQISQNLADQEQIAHNILAPLVELCEGRYYHTRGTEAHSGPSAQHEEQLARRLGAIPNEEGQHCRYDLWIRIGRALVNCMHHIGTTGSTHYESSAILRELTEQFAEAARWAEEPPDVVVRSHRHRFCEVRLPTARGYGISCVTPGWQGKTPFMWRVAGVRLTTPQFGGICVRQGDEEAYVREKFWTISRSKTEGETNDRADDSA